MSLSPGRPARARDERGFTMLLALYVLIITTLLLGAAFVAVLSDTAPARNDLDQKRAYAAAQAGIAQYDYDLNQNPNYWEQCLKPSGNVGAADSGSTESYAISPVPATGQTSCVSSNAITTMIEASGTAAAGTFRIASTGTSNKVSRTIVAQYSHDSFLNYVYFTNYENSDPEWAPAPSSGTNNCSGTYLWAGRNTQCPSTNFGSGDSVNGPLHSNDTVIVCAPSGSSTTFGRTGVTPPDAIETPNLVVQSCGGSFTDNGTLNNNVGTLQAPPDDTQLLAVADGGVSAQNNGCYTGAGCVFTGPTTIVLDGPTAGTNQITVTNASYNGGAATTLPYPSNGVVYVDNTTSCSYAAYTPFGSENQLYGGTTLDPNGSDTDNAGCGDAVVSAATSASSCSGTTQVSGVCPYTQSLTIGAADDIIIASNLTTTTTTSGCAGGESGGCPTGSATLGLIADHNVRIFHPLGSATARYSPGTERYCLQSSGANLTNETNTNGTGSLINPVIDAAIFAINDSFSIDNFDCGSTSNSNGSGVAPSQLGTVTINGTIAQNYRGRVGEPGQVSGYAKNYWYDSRLAASEPPSFLNPIGTTWVVTRLTECDGTTSC